ncbi:MAG: alkaline phosphatase family protein [Chloroflexi bacterium]|nr:alkaline phosphatase family protein [Chloroflexota bacterium]
MRNYLNLLPLTLLMLVLGLAGLGLAAFIQTQLVDYRSPYATMNLSPAPATPAVVDQLVVIVVDGLRFDTSRQAMAQLNGLRQRGADMVAQAGRPSYSLPGYAVLGTGAWQEVSGITMNSSPRSLRVDSLFHEVRQAGGKTALVGYSWWADLFGPDLVVKWTNLASDDPAKDTFGNLNNPSPTHRDLMIADEAVRILKEERPALLYVHFQGTEEQGRSHGVGSAYQEAAQRIDEGIGRIVNAMDLSKSVVIVTSDHGHIAPGGYGGWEDEVLTVPLVMAGKGVQSCNDCRGTQADIPTTAAFLLGVPFPTSTQGRVLWQALKDIPGEMQAQALLNLAQTQRAFYAVYVPGMGGPNPREEAIRELDSILATRQWEDSSKTIQAYLNDLYALARATRSNHLLGQQLILSILPAILLLAGFWVQTRRPEWRPVLAVQAGLAWWVLSQLMYLILTGGFYYSLSVVHDTGDFIWRGLVPGAIAALIVSVGLARWRLRAMPPASIRYAQRAILFGMIYVGLLQVTVAAIPSGIWIGWTLPDPLWGYVEILGFFQLAGLGVAAPMALLLIQLVSPPAPAEEKMTEEDHDFRRPASEV